MENISLETLELLEARLQRLEYTITGNAHPAPRTLPHASTITTRLERLEKQLQNLATKSSSVAELLRLQAHDPTLFSPSTTNSPPSSLSPSQLSALILSSAPLFSETTSRLTSLSDLPVPSTSSLASLITLQPRITKAARRQAEQQREIAELRARTASVLERWYEIGVLGVGEQWVGWQERLEKVERGVRRVEGVRAREDAL
ncbi:MAG: hypothetical protein M1820_007449 [Bogoriella megaspora]|nr:MAG: hypothetical protein M1820_007449 [Bogoriella megaspora]